MSCKWAYSSWDDRPVHFWCCRDINGNCVKHLDSKYRTRKYKTNNMSNAALVDSPNEAELKWRELQLIKMGFNANEIKKELEKIKKELEYKLTSAVTSAKTAEAGHTEYTIRTTDSDGNYWETVTRYSKVVQLLKDLNKKFKINLPQMPGKSFFRNTDELIRDRKDALNKVLEDMVNRYLLIPEIRLFLKLDHQGRKLPPKKGGKISQKTIRTKLKSKKKSKSKKMISIKMKNKLKKKTLI